MKIPHDPEEIIALVDETDRIVGETTRKEAHEKGLLHREAYVYILNSKKHVLMQKRKDHHLWDHSAAGHFPKNQNYEEAALREAEEELGIKLDKIELKEIAYEKLKVVRKDWGMVNYRFFKIYLVRKDIPLDKYKPDRDEVEEVKYFSKKDLEEVFRKKEEIIIDTTKYILKKYVMKEME